jgi:hypothetical protein
MQCRERIHPFLNSSLGFFVRNPISSHFLLKRSLGSLYFSSPNIRRKSSARYFYNRFRIIILLRVRCLVQNKVSHTSLKTADIFWSIYSHQWNNKKGLHVPVCVPTWIAFWSTDISRSCPWYLGLCKTMALFIAFVHLFGQASCLWLWSFLWRYVS